MKSIEFVVFIYVEHIEEINWKNKTATTDWSVDEYWSRLFVDLGLGSKKKDQRQPHQNLIQGVAVYIATVRRYII